MNVKSIACKVHLPPGLVDFESFVSMLFEKAVNVAQCIVCDNAVDLFYSSCQLRLP